MRKHLLYLCWLLGAIASGASAEQFGTPVSICLDSHTLPLIKTDKPAAEIVDAAWRQCAEELQQWRDERKSLPSEMVTKQDQQLHDFYVRMIEIRRKAPATAE
ncbi:Uncharacterised protein [Raoultella terrigena]|uniref:hypothetical protein n=1 Tax=Raoultella terrigena TaxID=577 RepID=UPI000DFCD0F5|nr:hypothetical protein [Raoultella terrigena]SUQ58637.1 Uncharacterised protein [Raoultella terrigena]